MKRTFILSLFLLPAALNMTAQTEARPETTGNTTTTTANSTAATARGNATQQQTYVFRYGSVNADSVLRAMPQYTKAQADLATLRQKYDKEMARAEDEFNTKYENFLDAQRDLVPSILRKRQAELQDMMDKNIAFKAEARRLLAEAEDKAISPLRQKVQAVITLLAEKMQLAFVLNTASDSCPYVNPALSVDITQQAINTISKLK